MNYILVHGAWHGGWCWERVRVELEATGNKVYTPTLTGLGEQAHLLSKEVGLETHVGDILDLIESENLNDVILVGHSYAGIIVTLLTERVPKKLARIIYLDAIVPRSGQCFLDCIGSEFRSYIESQVEQYGDGWKVPVVSKKVFGLESDEDINWVMSKLVSHPYQTFIEPVYLESQNELKVPTSYINCIGDKPRGGLRSVQAEGIDDYYELETSHDAMVTAPIAVAELIQKISIV
ncbi:MAG: alpha/beta fold hydrolase [Gammaproteobacteria bacterium]|nr:alpha/beta fold hydrolase [Gammaproteobacteria bacterium]